MERWWLLAGVLPLLELNLNLRKLSRLKYRWICEYRLIKRFPALSMKFFFFRKLLRKYGFREFINPEMTAFTGKGDVAAFKLDYKKQQSVTLNTHQYTCQIFQTGSAKVMGHKWAQGYQRWPTNTRVGLHEFSDQLRQG
ncbi:uncharacterized protein [Rutidosis leptorrhynchoides]|uniref:uncharacterized protein isoform X2 n=1 Tax=Rutidosis leptorrhynchoides TaxID=125765 RepID=UPI003A9A3255